MNQFLILFISLFLGYLVRKIQGVERNQVSLLNSFILYVSLPAQIFLLIPGLNFNISLILPILISWIIFLTSFCFMYLFGKILSFNRTTVICLIMVCGLGNTSFVGLPLIENYYGKEGVSIGIYVDQFGTFLSLSIIGFPFLLIQSGTTVSVLQVLKRIIFFPPFLAILIAFSFKSFSMEAPFPDVLKRLGDTLAPIALFSVGVQLNFREIKGRTKEIILGLFYKLILSPAIIYVLYILLIGMKDLTGKISVFEASMGPMITSSILASERNMEPELASILLALGIILSFFSSFIWYLILQRI